MNLIVFIACYFSILHGLHGQDVSDPVENVEKSDPQDADSAAQNALKELHNQQEENVNSNLGKSVDEGENVELHIAGLKTMEEEKKQPNTNSDEKNRPNLTELLSGIKKSEKTVTSSRVEKEGLKGLDSPFDKAEEGNITPDSESEKDEQSSPTMSKTKIPVVAAENAEASRVMEGLDEDAITKDIEQLQKKLGILQENIDKVLLESDGKETLGKRRKRETGSKDQAKLPEIEDMSKTLENVLKTVDSIQKYLDSALSGNENEELKQDEGKKDNAKKITKDEKDGEDTEKSAGKDYAEDESSLADEKSSSFKASKEDSKESAGKTSSTEIKAEKSESGGRKRKDDRIKKAKKSKQQTTSKES